MNYYGRFFLVTMLTFSYLQASEPIVKSPKHKSRDGGWQKELIFGCQKTFEEHSNRLGNHENRLSILEQQEEDTRQGLQEHVGILKSLCYVADAQQVTNDTLKCDLALVTTQVKQIENKRGFPEVLRLQNQVKRQNIIQVCLVGVGSLYIAVSSVLITLLWNR